MSANPRLGPHVKHNRRNPCPVCKGASSYCLTFEDGWTICGRIESEHAAGLGWLHNTSAGHDWPDRVFPAPAPMPIIRRAAPPTLDAIYRRLLALCPLSDAHRAQLEQRGMEGARITSGRYGSLPATGRRAIAEALVAEFGSAAAGETPGLYRRRDNTGASYWTIAGRAGLLIAITDPTVLITGFQIRADDTGDGSRYQWLSSKDREGGTSSGAPLHVERPIAGDVDPSAPVIITEGPLKSAIAADRLGCIVIAVPGVSVIAGVLPALRELGSADVIIAYDMDAGENPHVLRSRDDLAAMLLAGGCAIELATWDARYKGLDDALLAGEEPIVGSYPLQRRAGQLEAIPAAAVPIAKPRATHTIAGARSARARLFRDLIVAHEPGTTIDASITGGGKTGTLARELVTLHASGEWPRIETKKGDRPARILYVAPTTEAAESFRDMSGGLAMLVEGRSADLESRWNCVRPNLIAALGATRALPMIDACQTCKAEHEAAYGYWSCGYLEMKRIAEERTLIAAPAASFFNGSSELRKFDVIVVDEAITPILTETQTVASRHVADWSLRMNQLSAESPLRPDGSRGSDGERYGDRHPLRRLVTLLGMLVEHRPTEYRVPAMPVLRELCPDLDHLIADLERMPPSSKSGRYPFETPQPIGYDGEGLFPLRLMHDLIGAIAAELRPTGTDTRLWLTRDGLQLFLVRQHLVDILRAKTVINLDATPNPLVRFLFPRAHTVAFDAPAPTFITQVKDVLATRRELSNPRRLGRIVAALEASTVAASAPVVFTFKSLDPNMEGDGTRLRVSNPRAQYGHFGKETRSLNRFADADMLAIVGHYSAPIDVLRMDVQGLRFNATPEAHEDGETLRLLPYQWRSADGSGLGRWTRATTDPDLDAQIRWSESSTIVQAIGRGRATLRNEDAPLEVLLIGNMPVAGLPIDRLVTLEGLGADPPRRTTPAGFYEQRDERNAEAESANRVRVIEALRVIQAEGAPITGSEVARRSGVSRERLSRNATLKALVRQAQWGANAAVTEPVTPSRDNDIYVTHQGVTPQVTKPRSVSDQARTPQGSTATPPQPALTPSESPLPRPDIEPARIALSAADRAREREALHRTQGELGVRLGEIARLRGRRAVPKPSAISRSAPRRKTA